MTPRLTTPRLVLRPFEEADAKALNRVSNEPWVLKWMPDWAMDVEGTRRLIGYFTSKLAQVTPDSARVMLAVTLDGEVIGMVGIGNKEEVDNEIEIAYFISEAHAGKGYITEAAQAMTRWALQTLSLPYLMAIVETDNYPSQRVVERCGFERLETRMILNSGETEEKPFYYYRAYRDDG